MSEHPLDLLEVVGAEDSAAIVTEERPSSRSRVDSWRLVAHSV